MIIPITELPGRFVQKQSGRFYVTFFLQQQKQQKNPEEIEVLKRGADRI